MILFLFSGAAPVKSLIFDVCLKCLHFSAQRHHEEAWRTDLGSRIFRKTWNTDPGAFTHIKVRIFHNNNFCYASGHEDLFSSWIKNQFNVPVKKIFIFFSFRDRFLIDRNLKIFHMTEVTHSHFSSIFFPCLCVSVNRSEAISALLHWLSGEILSVAATQTMTSLTIAHTPR